MSEIIIRKLNKNDAKALIEYSKYIGGESNNLTFGEEGFQISLEDEKGYIESVNSSERSIMLGAFVCDELIADGSLHAHARRMSHRAELGISVRKPYWNMGIGKKLMLELIGFAKECGIELIDLQVLEINKAAIHLYESFGFEIIGKIPAFFKIGDEYFDAIAMCLDIRKRMN
ncbi:MAG: GNAT family N-acetyltransferase [Clostridia bacterium]|nr:GNAT family N-acetyltransferase [Clostridia bacterium]